jgi:hypothetical protein
VRTKANHACWLVDTLRMRVVPPQGLPTACPFSPPARNL